MCAFGARGPARYFGGETALARRMHRRGGGSRRPVPRRGRRRAVRRAAGRPRPGPGPRDTPRPVGGVPGPAPGQRPGGPGPGRAADPARPAHAGGPGRPAVRRRGRPVRRRGRGRAPAGQRPRFPAAGGAPPAEDLSVVREFDPPEPLAEPVVFAAKALAERMHEGLAARGLSCVRVQVRAAWADGRESRRLWRHDGFLSAAAVADRVRWQLDGWRPRCGTDGDRAPAASRSCGWCRTRSSAPPVTSSRSGERPWSATGWRGPPCASRPSSGTRRYCARSQMAGGISASR